MGRGIYTPDEVAAEYRQAKDKRAQIHILAELQQCSMREIIDLLRERGVYEEPDNSPAEEKRAARVAFSDEELAVIRECVAEGVPLRDIAARLGRTESSIIHKVRRLGLKTKYPRGRPKSTVEADESDEYWSRVAESETVDPERDDPERDDPERDDPERDVLNPEDGLDVNPESGIDVNPESVLEDPEAGEARETPKIEVSPTTPLGMSDKFALIQFIAALYGSEPVKLTVMGSEIFALFPNGCVSISASRWRAKR